MISTERLAIRRVRADDWRAIQTIWVKAAKAPYARYDIPNDTRDDAVMSRIEKWASYADSTEHMFFAVCKQEKVIGYVSLNQRDKGYEIGYCFNTDYHGHGYARESISKLTDVLRAGGSLIIARTALRNTPSVRLLSSLGFRMTGTEKVSFYKDGAGDDIYFDGGIFELKL